MINCLMVTGLSLTDEIRYVLYRSAFEMAQKDEQGREIRSDVCDGEIRSEYKYGRIGNVRGTVFSATLETNRGSGKVTFIVNIKKLLKEDEGVWVSIPIAGMPPTPDYVH